MGTHKQKNWEGIIMNEEAQQLLEEYYNKQENKQKAIKLQKQKEDLIARGLHTYDELEKHKIGYHYNQEKGKYVKKVAIDITDEEYEKVKQYPHDAQEDGSLRIVLRLITFITFLFGTFLGIFVLEEGIMFSLVVWGSTLVIGTILMSLARIIDLLSTR